MIDPAQAHFQRASAFLMDAKKAASVEDKSRFLASAVENAVAIVETFLSQAKDVEKVRQLAWTSLPRYRLLKRVRIHEFHRRPIPLITPDERSKRRVFYMLGPITLSTGTAPNSSASVSLTPQGPQYEVTGSGAMDRKGGGSEKEICIVDGKLWDEFSGDRIGLEQAVEEFLGKVPDFLEAVKKV